MTLTLLLFDTVTEMTIHLSLIETTAYSPS